MFDKENYRKNRKAGLRGQGKYPNLLAGIDTEPASSSRGLGLRKRRHPEGRPFTNPAHGRLYQVRHLINQAWLAREKRREAQQ